MFDFAKFIPQFQAGMAEMKNIALHALNEAKAQRVAAQESTRILAQEFGVLDADPNSPISPRRLSKLPLIVEDKATDTVDLDVQALNQGRPPSRGFYANLGDQPFSVALIGVGGDSSATHTLLPGASIPVSSVIARIIIEPVQGTTAVYQVYLQ